MPRPALDPPPRRRSTLPATTVALALAALAWLAPAVAGAAEALRIAAPRAPVSLPLYVAQERGFFADEHLDVALIDCIGGTRCLRMVLDDRADLAVTSEMPVVLQAFAHADIAILATVAYVNDNLKLIARKARKIVASVSSPLLVEGRTLTLTTSIGIAFRREIAACDAATAEAMIGRADAALYATKQAGRNTWRVMADDVPIEEAGMVAE